MLPCILTHRASVSASAFSFAVLLLLLDFVFNVCICKDIHVIARNWQEHAELRAPLAAWQNRCLDIIFTPSHALVYTKPRSFYMQPLPVLLFLVRFTV